MKKKKKMKTSLKKLNDIEAKLKSSKHPEARIIFVDVANGETREQAQSRYEKEHSLKPMSSDNYIFINVPSDEQIRARKENEKPFTAKKY